MTATAAAVAAELVELEHELAEAVRRHDTERLEQLLAAEFTLNGAAGVLDREAFLAAAAGPYRIEEFAYEELDPEVYGDTAVCVARYRQRARLDGRDLSGTMHVTDVWVRRDARWQIVRRHASPAG
jgi:ketosteroid isomerase-like protein